jgi:hypothetical protein
VNDGILAFSPPVTLAFVACLSSAISTVYTPVNSFNVQPTVPRLIQVSSTDGRDSFLVSNTGAASEMNKPPSLSPARLEVLRLLDELRADNLARGIKLLSLDEINEDIGRNRG